MVSATHCVSLFLPNTITWSDNEIANVEETVPPSPPRPSIGRHARHFSAVELPRRNGSLGSIFAQPSSVTPPLTPSLATTNFADLFGLEGDANDVRKRYFARPGDPRTLVRSDAEAIEWGQERRFNQPSSRARPFLSNSILDFAKAYDEGIQQRERQKARNFSTSPVNKSFSSRSGSHERAYENQSWSVQGALQGNGGLTNAMRVLADDLAENGGNQVLWIGTLGFPTDALPPSTKADITDTLYNEHQSTVVYTSDKDMDGHYNHFCKTILWPIFHYQVPDHQKSKAYADHSWEFYQKVNQAFADKVVESYKRGDTIWVHDYHLLLVPGMIREKLKDARIGFFLHTAFPSSEIFRCLSKRKELLEGMLGANLVAFQTDEYVLHFLQTCARLLAVETTSKGVQLENHFVDVIFQPIGIVPLAIQKVRETDEVATWIKEFQKRWDGKKLIVARDKFDNVHGIRQKLLAYELFLNKYPEWKKDVVLIQVATSTSKQAELLTTISDITDRIESQHHDLQVQPLVFFKHDLEFAQYLALLSTADVLMNCSLRDGMNLTAHEFIYCQDGALTDKKHGPVILSEFTGCAALFGEDQISINPWHYHQLADAIKQALEMDEVEKKRRWTGLYSIVQTRTGWRWAKELGDTLARVHDSQSRRDLSSVPRLSAAKLEEKYKQASRRVFFIDYEGTLSPHRTTRGIPMSSPYKIIATLNELTSDPKNTVYIMSSRRQEELYPIFRTATNLGLIAENGCFILPASSPLQQRATGWLAVADLSEIEEWLTDAKSMLQKYYGPRMDGGSIEERLCSFLFKYDGVGDQEAAKRLASDYAHHINSSGYENVRIQAVHVPDQKAVLIEPVEFSKKTAAEKVLRGLNEPKPTSPTITAGAKQEFSPPSAKSPTADSRMPSPSATAPEPDFLMVAGDDREDEVVFHWANELASQRKVKDVFTVSVGKRNTQAAATVPQGASGLLAALQGLAKISMEDMPRDGFGRLSRHVS